MRLQPADGGTGGGERGPAVRAVPRNPLARFASYSFRVPAAVPYWGRDTYTAILDCLLHGRLVDGPAPAILSRRLSDLFGAPGIRLYGSGRSALEAGLRAGDIGPGSEIVLPSFCCESVLTPVLAVGARPVFADAGPELNITRETAAACITDRTRAVFVPHLFGNPADIEAIAALCRPRGIMVVDDAAQALGGTAGGRPLGAMGDWGILSFGNGKICTGTGGGALLSMDAAFLDREARVPRYRARGRDVAARAWSTLLWRRWRRWALPLQRVGSRLFGESDRHVVQRVEAPRNLDAAVAITLLDTLPRNLEARRARAARYQQELGGLERIGLVRHRPGSACLAQVIHVEPRSKGAARAERVRHVLLSAGYEVTRSYRPLHLTPAGSGGSRAPLSIEDRWTALLELPCDPSVSLDDVARICQIIRSGLG